MTPELIRKVADDVHKTLGFPYTGFLEEYTRRIIEIEREACAAICDEQAKEPECPERAQYCADAIRDRSNALLCGDEQSEESDNSN
jgi:hypothetical protein